MLTHDLVIAFSSKYTYILYHSYHENATSLFWLLPPLAVPWQWCCHHYWLHTNFLSFSGCFPSCSATCYLLLLLLSHCTVTAIVDATMLLVSAVAISCLLIGCFMISLSLFAVALILFFLLIKILRFSKHYPSKLGRSCCVAIPCITKLVLLAPPVRIAADDCLVITSDALITHAAGSSSC